MDKLKLLDLFSGIGGFSLGLERTGGFETVAQCEIEPFCQKILAKHWPEVKRYEDIRDLTAARLRADGIAVDAICGGFPCQDISPAGSRKGIEGDKSGLWSEFARLIGELRPSVVFVENSADIACRGLGRVLGDLATLGFSVEGNCIPAAAVGADHIRDRYWLCAYADDAGGQGRAEPPKEVGPVSRILADTVRSRFEECHFSSEPSETEEWSASSDFSKGWSHGYAPEPAIPRVENGIPKGLDEIAAYGNAVAPQIPELLGNAYLESIGWRDAH